MTIAEQIRHRIEEIPVGEPFTTASLLALGSRSSVDQTLHRLAQRGTIASVSRGVFVRPKLSRFVGVVMPEPAKVAEVVARATGDRIQPHGAEAARHFGLSTQVSVQPVYLTTGPTRRLRIGQLEVLLKHTTPRKLALAGRPAGLALGALLYLGRREVTFSVLETIRRKLPRGEFQALREVTAAMPAWLADLFHRFEGERAVG